MSADLVDVMNVLLLIENGLDEKSAQRIGAQWEAKCEELATAAAHIEALEVENARLQRDCAEAYQVVGTLAGAHVDLFNDPQVVKALDNLSAAVDPIGPRPHDDLLPFAPISTTDPVFTAESRADAAESALALVGGGLELLLAAVHADDPKRELLVRIGDLMRDANPNRAFVQQHEGKK